MKNPISLAARSLEDDPVRVQRQPPPPPQQRGDRRGVRTGPTGDEKLPDRLNKFAADIFAEQIVRMIKVGSLKQLRTLFANHCCIEM